MAESAQLIKLPICLIRNNIQSWNVILFEGFVSYIYIYPYSYYGRWSWVLSTNVTQATSVPKLSIFTLIKLLSYISCYSNTYNWHE